MDGDQITLFVGGAGKGLLALLPNGSDQFNEAVLSAMITPGRNPCRFYNDEAMVVVEQNL